MIINAISIYWLCRYTKFKKGSNIFSLHAIKNQIYRLKNRRKFTTLISRFLKKTIILEFDFTKDNYSYGRIVTSAENEDHLWLCKKSGSWKVYNLILKKQVKWTSRYRNYFLKLNPTETIITKYDKFLTGADLIYYKNVKIVNKKNNSNSLNLYNGKIISSRSTNSINKAFYLDTKGNESFQHFIHECLPVMMLGKTFLEENPDVPVILKYPLDNFSSRNEIIRMLGIKNQVIYSNQPETSSVKELYVLDFKPKNYLYASTPKFRNLAYLQILNNKQIKTFDKQLIVFLMRDGHSRKVMNFVQIEKFISKKAQNLDLDFKIVNTSKILFSELLDIMGNSKFVFGVHGGANYNMIFAPPTATFIEFINTESTDAICDLVTSFGQTYFPFAIRSSKGDEFIRVEESDLKEIFELI